MTNAHFENDTFAQFSEGFDTGMFDETTRSIWWAGDSQNRGSSKVFFLNPAFTFRNQLDGNSDATAPFFRMGFGAEPGDVIDIDCGSILIENVDLLANTYTGVLLSSIDNAILNDPFHTIAPIPAGEWKITTPVNYIVMSHLIGMNVGLLVDGIVYPEQIVPESGIITWPVEYATTRAVCGLPYQAQLQTLYLDTGDPTIQGKRKLIPAVTVRVDCTAGLKMGVDFDHLVEYKNMQVAYNVPPDHFTGDQRIAVPNDWNKAGQICIQQDYPLPATVLGVIPEVLVGDNQR